MQSIQDFADLLAELDEEAGLLSSQMTSPALLKSYARKMIYLSKFVTIFDEQHKKQKALLDKQITIMVMDLIRSSKVKHKNKAQVMAESHYDKEMDGVLDLEIILRKAEILYRSYKTFLDVAHTELRYLQKDMVQTNMHNQYANWSKTGSGQQQMSQIAKQMQQH